MARTSRGTKYRKSGRIKKIYSKDKSLVARAALELKRVQETLLSGQSSKQRKGKSPSFNLTGNRIVNLKHFGKSLQSVINHASVCPSDGKPRIVQEIERKGLGCVIQFRCDGCGMTLAVETQPKSKGPSGQMRHSINIASVWGFLSIGGGYANMKEVLSTLNIPSPDSKTFSKVESQIGALWKEAITSDMIEAGKEERQLEDRK